MVISRSLLKARKGQSRILEAVIAAVIIFIVFSVSMFLIRASDVKILQERADLDRLGYNILHRLVEGGTIEATLETSNPTESANYLKALVQRSVPFATYFNLTIFNVFNSTTGQVDDEIPLKYVTHVDNTLEDVFASSMEVSSTSLIYTSKTGNIYHLVLVLTRGGQG